MGAKVFCKRGGDMGKWLLGIGLFTLCIQSSGAASFGGIERFNAVNLGGELEVICKDYSRRMTARHQCEQVVLEPGERAHFFGVVGNIDQVIFRSSSLKSGDALARHSYIGEIGRTRGPVNLWVSSIIEQPLLSLGNNEILVEYGTYDRPVLRETVVVHVGDGGSRLCQPEQVVTSNFHHCRSPLSICHEYFERRDNCR